MSYLNTDVPELKGYDTGTVLGNIELLESRLEGVLEATLGELSELADAIIQDASGDPDTVFSILLSLRGQPSEEGSTPLKSRHLLSQNVRPLSDMTRHLGLYERLVLYRLVSERAPALPILGKREENTLPATAKGRVAYMSGAFADKAYIRFAERIPHCRAAGFHSFVDACEEVWSGLCEFCILPLESAAEGKLMGFSRLIVKYRLQIVAVCEIAGAGGAREDATSFALLRSAGEDWEAEPSPLANETTPLALLEVLHTTANPPYSEVMAAAEFCGLTPIRADTLPMGAAYALQSDEDRRTDEPSAPLISTVWRLQGADLTAFLCYLSLEASEDPVLGLYPLISF